ncbi:MAG: hypothetical protein LAO18_15305 [Acidobacteriia bacterium]|nr:hypothetical protein [Terriglobia bacterium]
MLVLDPPSFYTTISRIEYLSILTVIVVIIAVGLVHVLTWGVDSCCQHVAKAVTSVRKLKHSLWGE